MAEWCGQPPDLLQTVIRDFSGDEIQKYLEVFLEEHCDVFAADERFLHLAPEMYEHDHAWHALFQVFVGGIEERLRDFLACRGWSMDDFCVEAERLLSGEVAEQAGAQALLKVTLSYLDYWAFLSLVKDYILRRNEGSELSAIFAPLDIKPRTRTRGESMDTTDIETIDSITERRASSRASSPFSP
jgi:hypothetical protein